MSEKKPALCPPLRVRPICPVCGKVSYSLGGMHPQCAVVQADAGMRASRKAKKEAPTTPRTGFTKRCRGCGRTVPARRMVCDCGRSFARIAPAASNGSPPSLAGVAKMTEIPDRTITQQVSQKLSSRGINSPSQVNVQTKRGEVTLSGVVQYPHQKSSAVNAATSVMGVRRVIDNMTVKAVVRY